MKTISPTNVCDRRLVVRFDSMEEVGVRAGGEITGDLGWQEDTVNVTVAL